MSMPNRFKETIDLFLKRSPNLPPKKKKHHEAEALFKSPQIPSLSEQAQIDRAADALALQDKTAKLKSLRLAKVTSDREGASDKSIQMPAGLTGD